MEKQLFHITTFVLILINLAKLGKGVRERELQLWRRKELQGSMSNKEVPWYFLFSLIL